jgi:hypothetical protein
VTVASPANSWEVREELESLVERELLGPWDGADEELPPGVIPSERYILGKLVPAPSDAPGQITDAETASSATTDEDLPELADDAGTDVDPDDPDAAPAPAAIRTRRMAASALGLSFQVADDVDALTVEASWGRYERAASEHQETPTGRPSTVWRRRPMGGPVEIPLTEPATGDEEPDSEQEQVRIRWNVRHLPGRRVVEIFLLNAQPELQETPDLNRLFQAQLRVTALDGQRAVFLGHNDPDLQAKQASDPERRRLDLLHRRARLYAHGRQCAVDAKVRDEEARAWELTTTCFPTAEVELVEPGDPETMPGIELDMSRLGSLDLSPDALQRSLRPLVTGFRAWLDQQERRIADDPEIQLYADTAAPAIGTARQIADRLGRAIELLRDDGVAREAFRFANQAMAMQRVRSELARLRPARPEASVAELVRELDRPDVRSWRPFQLAFVLLCLPGLANPDHPDALRGVDDAEVQLLFFPTGGGKTEAYLGLTAFTLAIRRLQGVVGEGDEARDGTDGVAVLMRYTLRLLTAQQFQRATTLICACELLRKERLAGGDQRWGDVPFRIGLWVGLTVTPNSYDEAKQQIIDAAGQDGQVGGLLQLATCPWCASQLHLGRDYHADDARRRVILHCSDPDGRCEFTPRHSPDEGIPAVVVDEEVYRLVPSLIIGTVDKFAQLPWRAATGQLFGVVSSQCPRHGYRHADNPSWCKTGRHNATTRLPAVNATNVMRLRPPDLVIQDELHLISDALGSMVGLYEAAIDRLCSRVDSGKVVRPVLVASTATVRRAGAQVREVFGRDLTVFPPQVIDAGETFFSTRVTPSADRPGRRYRGILAPGERLTSLEIRVMTALLEYGQHLFNKYGSAADPYMTVVDYFTSTRELAGMRRLVEDDVSERLNRQAALEQRRRPDVSELTSRMASGKITQSLADLDRIFEPFHDSTQGIDALRALRKSNKAEWDRVYRPARPIDVLLATSMLQVGVDVPRLGLMLVTGQPKNMAEYIQATSRVGRDRRRPGVVFTIYQWSRPRDLAHFEHFGYDHATFGLSVEGLTTTPFSERALDRGLAGMLVASLRHSGVSSQSNSSAQNISLNGPMVDAILDALRDRVERATSPEHAHHVRQRARHLLDTWFTKRTTLPVGTLGYEKGVDITGLLREPDDPPWEMWSAPMSLRDVEPEVLLQLRRDDVSLATAPSWDFSDSSGGGS